MILDIDFTKQDACWYFLTKEAVSRSWIVQSLVRPCHSLSVSVLILVCERAAAKYLTELLGSLSA